jgi:hypothetical protein
MQIKSQQTPHHGGGPVGHEIQNVENTKICCWLFGTDSILLIEGDILDSC